MQSESGCGWAKTEVATMTTESAKETRSFTMGAAYRIIEVLPNLLTPDSNGHYGLPDSCWFVGNPETILPPDN
jgi:hypothetical protein